MKRIKYRCQNTFDKIKKSLITAKEKKIIINLKDGLHTPTK